jgi:hypothetical protein
LKAYLRLVVVSLVFAGYSMSLLAVAQRPATAEETYANPMDLTYRFQLELPSAIVSMV